MNVDPISASFGGCLILFAGLLRMSQRAAWQRDQMEFANDPRELRHYEARNRRRNRTSGLIAVVGLMIPVADLPIVWQQAEPVISTILWISIFVVCLWIGLLAIGDYATTRAHSRANLLRLQLQKKELVNQLEAMRPGPPTKTDGSQAPQC